MTYRERFHWCHKPPYWFTETKGDFCIKIEFKSRRIALIHQYGRRFFVWNTNMAAVTSRENAPLLCTTITTLYLGPGLSILSENVLRMSLSGRWESLHEKTKQVINKISISNLALIKKKYHVLSAWTEPMAFRYQKSIVNSINSKSIGSFTRRLQSTLSGTEWVMVTLANSVFEPSGPSGRSVSQFPHEATRSISTPPWVGC